jgi:hypothetical protein
LEPGSLEAELYAMKIQAAFINFIATLFIFLFTYTAINKLVSFASFRYTISQSPLIAPYSSWIAALIPSLELATVVLLFIPKTKLAGLYASLGLMGILSFYIGYALVLGSKLPCSCGGIIQNLSWQQHFWINIVLTLLAVIATHLQAKIQLKLKFLLQ